MSSKELILPYNDDIDIKRLHELRTIIEQRRSIENNKSSDEELFYTPRSHFSDFDRKYRKYKLKYEALKKLKSLK